MQATDVLLSSVDRFTYTIVLQRIQAQWRSRNFGRPGGCQICRPSIFHCPISVMHANASSSLTAIGMRNSQSARFSWYRLHPQPTVVHCICRLRVTSACAAGFNETLSHARRRISAFEILFQTDRVGAKSPIFDLFSLVATQP